MMSGDGALSKIIIIFGTDTILPVLIKLPILWFTAVTAFENT